MTVSAQTSGWEWGTPQMEATLDQLKSLGVRWIAIHPYARIETNGGVSFSQEAEPGYVTKPLDWAKARGMGVMLIPHIAYWGTPFLWRGEIDFRKPSEWNRFFADYQRWIVLMAQIAEAHHAKIFCVGLEYVCAQKYTNRWRQIIAAVRAVYHGKITYGANWSEFDNVKFWDALDYIGILGYFPVSNAPDPTSAEIAKGWEPWMSKLQSLSVTYSKPVLFTEVGYNESAECAAKPWAFSTGGADAAGVQGRCVEQALALESRFPFLAGIFFWKWFPDFPDPEKETFDMRAPNLQRIVAAHWGSGEAR